MNDLASGGVGKRFSAYWRLMRFDKPIGIFLLLWPALWALWIAGHGNPDTKILVIFCSGVVIMRAAGCVINDYADRKFDSHVERTRNRPLATGEISAKAALTTFAVLCALAFLLVLQLNAYAVGLSFVAVFLAASYPFMKRYTHLPQAYLGIAFGWAIPMAFAAQTETIPLVAWELFIVAILWALIYDTMYAMVDIDDDKIIGVKSTALLFGEWVRQILAGLQLAMTGLLFALGIQAGLGVWYEASLILAVTLFVYQQVLIYKGDRSSCFAAFLNNHWLGAGIFVGIFLDYRLGGT